MHPGCGRQSRDGSNCQVDDLPLRWLHQLRPAAAAVTDRAKRVVMAAYGIATSAAGGYELDHLVPLNSGGSSDYRNLWPEPNILLHSTASAFVQNDKDAVEAYTFKAICSHRALFVAVQNAMAADWTTAVQVVGLPAMPQHRAG